MKEKGKSLDTNTFNTTNYLDYFNYSSSTDMPCKKHPSSYSGGICPYCLNDRLVNLVCNECGEQRCMSSCSCYDVGKISFLIENKKENSDEVILVGRRSTSSCVEIKKSRNGFWKIKSLFFKNKKENGCGKNHGVDQKIGKSCVSRSRLSLCSFRGGGGFKNDADEGNDYAFQSAKISDVTGRILLSGFESRRSGFRGLYDVDSEPRNSGSRYLWDSENEPSKSGFRGLLDSGNIEQQRKSTGLRGFGDIEYQHGPMHLKKLPSNRDKGRSNNMPSYVCDKEYVSESTQSGLGSSQNEVNFFKVVRKMGGPGELNRVNSVPNRSIFPVKDNKFIAMDDDDDDDIAFIDFKIDQLSCSESKMEFSFASRKMSSAVSCDHQEGSCIQNFC